MKGSGDVKDQILQDGGSTKLYKACRKFLLSDKKMGLKKWASEALAYLTMDAETKELLVNDQVNEPICPHNFPKSSSIFVQNKMNEIINSKLKQINRPMP